MRRGEVVVRWEDIASAPTDDDGLSAAERQRCACFIDDADRRRFVGARLLLRHTVADVTGVDPGAIRLAQVCPRCGGPHGPPRLTVDGAGSPEVSFAHAGSIAIVALSRSAVGIDLEPVGATVDVRRWVRGEAVLKVTKHGLDVEQDAFDISESGRLTRWRGPGRRPVLRLRDVDTASGYVAAVARAGRWPLTVTPLR